MASCAPVTSFLHVWEHQGLDKGALSEFSGHWLNHTDMANDELPHVSGESSRKLAKYFSIESTSSKPPIQATC